MNKLKLKDFLDLYNFRNYREEVPEYKRNDTDRLEITKYCKFCKKRTTHKETK